MKAPCLSTIDLLVVLLLLQCPGQARAQQEDLAQAKALFSRAEVQYRLGNFREALGNYQQALKHANKPNIIFNIAQCHRQLKEHQKALFYYKLFLTDWARKRPGKKLPHQKEVDRRIREMTEAVAQDAAKKQAEEQARAAAAKRQAEEQAAAQEAAKKQAEEQAAAKKQAEERARAEEARRAAEEKAQKAAEEKAQKAAEEKARAAAAGKQADPGARPLPGKGKVKIIGLKIPGASVYFSGVLRARTPLTGPITAYAARYRVRVEAEGFVPWEQVLKVKAGETTDLLISMKRAPSPKTFMLGISIVSLVFAGGCEGMAWYFQGEMDDGGDNSTNEAMMIAGHVMAGAFGGVAIGTFAAYLLSFKIDEDDGDGQKSVSLVPSLGGITALGRF